MQQLQHVLEDRLLLRRLLCAIAGTVAVLLFSPPLTVLLATSLLLWPLAWCEWRGARTAQVRAVALACGKSATA